MAKPESRSPVGPWLAPEGQMDVELLKRQAALLGKVVDGRPLTPEERTCLAGLWELVHKILDGADGSNPGPATYPRGAS